MDNVNVEELVAKLKAIDQVQAVIEFNMDGTVITANENFLKTLGYTLDEIKGQHHRVCLEALDWRGSIREHIEEVFMDALTDVFVLERINVLDPDADKPILRGLFVQAIFGTLSRGMDILFVRAELDELPFWRDTIGARQIGDFIAASGARCLPVYPKPPRPVPARSRRPHPPRLRIVGKPRQAN